MALLKDYLNSQNIALYINGLPPVPTIDEALFPAEKILGYQLEYAKGAQQRPVALKVSTFDVAAKRRALSATVDILKKEMPFFKEAVGIKEQDRREIAQAMKSNNKNIIDMLMKKVFENYSTLVEGGLVQMKRMRSQLLQTGQINLVTNDGDIVVDYGVPKENKEVLSSKKWSSVDEADIIEDIKKWQQVIINKGYEKPTRLILTDKAFSYIRKNKILNAHLRSGVNANLIISDIQYKQALKELCDVEVAIVGGKYLDEAGKEQSYYKDNIVTLIPTGTIGKTVYGTTPEEFDKLYGSTKLDTQIVKTGIAITTMVNEDPVGVDTKVSMVGMPSFERVDNCFFATVADE